MYVELCIILLYNVDKSITLLLPMTAEDGTTGTCIQSFVITHSTTGTAVCVTLLQQLVYLY